MKEQIVKIFKQYWKLIIIALGVLINLIGAIIFLAQSGNAARPWLTTGLVLIGGVIIFSFYKFFISEERFEHEFQSSHANLTVSVFYRVYFPAVLLSILVQFILQLNPQSLFSSDISPFGNMLYIIPGFVLGLAIIAVSDHAIRNMRISYSPRGRKQPLIKGIGYSLPFVGLYFGLRIMAEFMITLFFGPSALYTSQLSPFNIDSGAIFAAKVWVFSSKIEKALIPILFVVLYISMEVGLRGLVAGIMRASKLGPSAMIFVPAVVQAAAFSSGTLLFTDTILYVFRFMDAIVFGVLVGVVLWKTKRFDVTVLTALIMRFFDTGSEFFRTVMLSAPKILGIYDLNDTTTTPVENIASSIAFIKIFLIVLTPLLIVVAYDEVWSILTTVWSNFKKQWFGYMIIAIAFITIDIIFTFFINQLSFFVIIGYFLALFALRFVLPFLFNLLPTLDAAPMVGETGLLHNENQIDVMKDIKYLENDNPWYKHSKRYAIIASVLFIYFLFIGAAYRQYLILDTINSIKFTIFLVILPTALLGISTYFIVDRYAKGYFFAESWRNQLFIFLIFIYGYNLLTWTVSGAIANFAWRNLPFFIIFTILIFPKPINSAFRSFTLGLSREGRYATFRWVINNSKEFEDVFPKLIELPSDTITSGVFILRAQLGHLDEWDNLEALRDENISKGERLGRVLAVGLKGTKVSEGVLLDQISDDDLDIRIAAYWSLGLIGTTSALSRMAKVIEENPISELIKIAEKAILNIDPMYPLAGLREQAVLL